jgi:hypothetical protein
MTARRRLQVRVTLDSDMGSLFDWASQIPERARARELVGLLRVGHAIYTGSTAAAATLSRRASEPEAQRSERPSVSSSIAGPAIALELQGADATLEIFDELSVTAVPPP